MTDDTMAARIERVQARIAAACRRCGRRPDEVQLIAVSKTHPPVSVVEAVRAGLTLFGENKVQEARAKMPECPSHLSWHLIGHLQRNKAAVAVELFDMIHSVDSLRLLETIDRACEEAGRTMKVLLEVNVSGEGTKFGLKPDEVPAVLAAAGTLRRIEIRGLMTMPPFSQDLELVRPHFRRLRELRDSLEKSTGASLPELSMGMSHDFEIGIEEGAHWIRVGTALFGERPKKEALHEDP